MFLRHFPLLYELSFLYDLDGNLSNMERFFGGSFVIKQVTAAAQNLPRFIDIFLPPFSQSLQVNVRTEI
jgi:hypothetical protein